MASETDALIDELLGTSNNITSIEVAEAVPIDDHKKERLLALAAGGSIQEYLGKAYFIDQIESFQEPTIIKLYARYKARLGAILTKNLDRSALELAAINASNFLPIPEQNRPKLVADLKADPFIDNALNELMCEMFHKYGALLAPITAAILTAKHCDFQQTCSLRIPPQQNGFGGDDFTTTGDVNSISGESNYAGGTLDTDDNKSNKAEIEKDPDKVRAGKLGAKIRTHNLKQKLLNVLQGCKEEIHQAPVKLVETPAEINIDWSMLAIGAVAGTIALIALFNNNKTPAPEPVKQIIHKQKIPTQAPLAPFYME